MKLDRNINPDGKGKYALVLLREIKGGLPSMIKHPISGENCFLIPESAMDFGIIGTPAEFFLIRLRDKYAGPALHAYAEAAKADDLEWAAEVDSLAQSADRIMPKKTPD